jgi:hypothetical protein
LLAQRFDSLPSFRETETLVEAAQLVEQWSDEPLHRGTVRVSALYVAPIVEPIIATASVSGELLGKLSLELRAKMTGDVPQLSRVYRSM